MRKLMRIRDLRLFLFGDVVSTLGDSALWLAMAIWLKELTRSSAAAGLVFFAYLAGSLFSPLGGVLADRFRRRPLLICSNLMAAALVLLIVLVHHRSQIWLVYVVIFLYGVIGSTISPAQTVLMPALVPEDLLAEANSVQQTLNEGLRLIIPLVGAGLFVLVGAAAVAEIDAGTFLVAVASLLALRVEEPKPRPAEGAARVGRQHAAGLRFISREPVLRSITIALGLSMLVIGFTESALFSVVTVGLRHSASFVGVTMTVQGIGAVAGGLTAAALLKRVPEGMMTAIALALAAAGMLLLTVLSTPVVLAAMVLVGVAVPWVIVSATTAIQRRTPSELLGRVSGTFGLAVTLPQVLSVGLGAALIAVLNYRLLLLITAVVVTIATTFLISRPETRRPVVKDAQAPQQGPHSALPSQNRCSRRARGASAGPGTCIVPSPVSRTHRARIAAPPAVPRAYAQFS